ncbi:ATP-binding protein [Kitasatospora sp. NPDC058965]|uniref:ATP-binding protein n=1 Tax=Kitasatospora sp. NPDC058965 TaxID=3346682 RepID=UPI0036A5BBE9
MRIEAVRLERNGDRTPSAEEEQMPITEARLSWHYRVALPGVHPEAMALIRQIACSHLRLWGLAELSDVVALGVTELLTNVHKHTAGGCELEMQESGDGVRVSVRDFDDALPAVKQPDEDAVGGRGLLLLSRLVDELTVVRLPLGKRVSFLLLNALGEGSGSAYRGASDRESIALRLSEVDDLSGP